MTLETGIRRYYLLNTFKKLFSLKGVKVRVSILTYVTVKLC